MKYIVIILDGAADYPIDILGNKTPLEVADTPNMNLLAREGSLGRVKTVPSGFIPSSDVANLALLGYDPGQYYSGRGPLEAANMGVFLDQGDLAFRCNLITANDDLLEDYSAGHIRNNETAILMDFLDKKLGGEKIRFYAGKSYRNLMVYRDGAAMGFQSLKYHAPHDILGRSIATHLPRGRNSEILVDLMKRSRQLLETHEINKVRIDLGENPANMIWLWGCGSKPEMESFEKKFGLKGAVISAVDLINGIGRLIGLDILTAEGITGYYDTNYEGKARSALAALDKVDFVFIHIEATDEAGHNQDLRMKITCLERIDKMVVGTLLKGLGNTPFRMLITPDHPTPLSLRTHTDEPVPFLLYGNGIPRGTFSAYSEPEAQHSDLYFNKGAELIRYFLQK